MHKAIDDFTCMNLFHCKPKYSSYHRSSHPLLSTAFIASFPLKQTKQNLSAGYQCTPLPNKSCPYIEMKSFSRFLDVFPTSCQKRINNSNANLRNAFSSNSYAVNKVPVLPSRASTALFSEVIIAFLFEPAFTNFIAACTFGSMLPGAN